VFELKIVVAGIGPTGISVIKELLRQGIPARNIHLIDSSIDPVAPAPQTNAQQVRESIYDAVVRERINKGLGKNGQSLANKNDKFKTPSNVWGVSCLPPLDWDVGTDKFPRQDFADAYRRLAEEMEIQAEACANSQFEISGEVIGQLKRKALSHELVSIPNLHHSRLAVRTKDGCTLTGNCFVGCPNSAPWNPISASKKLMLEFPDLKFYHSEILSINLEGRSLDILNSTFKFDKLYLGLGGLETQRLLQKNFKSIIALDTTPVVILPLLFKRRQNDIDYNQSFLFTDLIIPRISQSKLMSLTQIYLPTKEITARAISRLPRIFHRILSAYLQSRFAFLFQRIGVAMVFLQATNINDQKLNSPEFNEARKELRAVLSQARVRIIPGKRELLLRGASYHYGSIRFEHETKKGVDSDLFRMLSENEIFLTDTCALPHIPPGPHTSISAALAKLIVEKSLE
jgi:hypothetical protein